ncbi:hypothetical protein [Lichenifustis flavocetrariae]|uniref:Uncharacterized protein n=1 Tax=Lichenifustis flavocetrariae TaxID=2949735 RepID=A0AA42CIP0_9HYPH|nr:hypothetical protein [Lichenifustis flavocetrariae]MCW6507081.1 hypothetical protein [Lichenifustis flavocetrariae]
MGLFGRKVQQPDPALARLARNLDEAEIRHLEVLRREVANLIVETDPDLMVRCYERAWAWERETAKNPDRLRADELALVAKIPMFQDFDIFGTRHFIPYAEGRWAASDDDLVERYLEIGRMLVLMKNRSEIDVVRRRPSHDEKEHKVLLDTVRKVKDRRFRARIEDAMRRCWAYRQGFGAGKGEPYAGLHETFSDAEVEVFQIPYGLSPDNETGIAFKKTDEYGVYSTFHDDQHDKTYESYYRTDAAFKARQSLAR